MRGTNLGRQVGRQARQGAERPREGPLQSPVDVLLVPQLLLELVHLPESFQLQPRTQCAHSTKWILKFKQAETEFTYILLQRELPLSPRLDPVHRASGRRAGRHLHHRHGLPLLLVLLHHHLNSNDMGRKMKRSLIQLAVKENQQKQSDGFLLPGPVD
jgi:hypothetical protein